MIHHFNTGQLDTLTPNSASTAVSPISMTQSQLGAQLLTLNSDVFSNLFFLSNQHNHGKPHRGGVPVLFPQFNTMGKLKKHGYVRDMPWKKLAEHTNHTQITTEFEVLVTNIKDWEDGQPKCQLRLITTVSQKMMEMRLYIHNTGNKAFSFTGGLHPYFYVHPQLNHKTDNMAKNPAQFSIQGLENTAWQNFADHKDIESGDIQLLGQHIERLYQTAPNINFANGQRQFEISCTGFNQWMIWNPGHKHAANMPDLQNHAWQQFICIEPVIVNSPVRLEAGEQFSGTLCITAKT